MKVTFTLKKLPTRGDLIHAKKRDLRTICAKIDRADYDALKSLAAELGTTAGELMRRSVEGVLDSAKRAKKDAGGRS